MNEGQGGLNSGSSALNGSGDFGAFNNNAPVQQPVMNNNYTTPQRPIVGNGGYTAPVQQPMASNNYTVPIQRPIASAPMANPAMGSDIIIDNGGGEPRKGWKKWLIGGLIGIGVLGAIVLAVLVVKKVSTSSAEEVREAYWSYMNYLIRGEDSTEVLAESEYGGAETAVQVAFDSNDEEYFSKLQKLFNKFYVAAERRARGEGEESSELMINLKNSFEFMMFLRKVGLWSEDELISEYVSGSDISDLEQERIARWSSEKTETMNEYIESRMSFAGLFEEYLVSLDTVGCLAGNKIDVVCGFGSGVEISDDVSALQWSISRFEELAISWLDSYSWTIGNRYMEEN